MIIGVKTKEIRVALDEFLEKTGLSIMDIYINFDMDDISAMGKEPQRLLQPKLTVTFHMPDKFINMGE